MADETLEVEEAVEESTEESEEETTEETTEEEEEASEVESEEESKEESKEETETVIPVRSNASHIIDRKDKKIAKLEAELADKDVEEEVKETVDPDITERLERIEQRQLAQADSNDLSSFFEQEPDARKYEKSIKAYMEHGSYKGAAPEVIYHHVAWKDSQSKTDSKRKAADLEAGQTKSAGSGKRDTKSKDARTATDIKNMTNEEFMAYEREQQKLARS